MVNSVAVANSSEKLPENIKEGEKSKFLLQPKKTIRLFFSEQSMKFNNMKINFLFHYLINTAMRCCEDDHPL